MDAALGRRGQSPSPMSIGEVLAHLRADFPDVSISKIRFLEEQGLVEPGRTPSGYRKFSHDDVQRLRYVLSLQRDHYLPLRVIRTHLEALDRGAEPPLPVVDDAPSAVSPITRPGSGGPRLVPDPDDTAPLTDRRDDAHVHLTRRDLCEAADVTESLLSDLESFGLIAHRPGHRGYGIDALVIARTAGELSRFGIEPRHLRAFRATAEREAGLVEQVVAPLRRQRAPESQGRAEETAREVASLCVRLHAALLKDALDG